MPTGSADAPCQNAGDGEHGWQHNAVLGMQCTLCGASRAHDPERDPVQPNYYRRRGRRGPSRKGRQRPRGRAAMFADTQRPEHRDLRVAGEQ